MKFNTAVIMKTFNLLDIFNTGHFFTRSRSRLGRLSAGCTLKIKIGFKYFAN